MSSGTPGSDALARFLAARRDVPFVWGASDCALLVCDWVREVTGVDPAARVRGRYETKTGAMIVLDRFGGFAGFARMAGLRRAVAPARGDVGVISAGSREKDALGICLGEGWAFQGGRGLALVTRPVIRKAWACRRP